MDNQKEYFSPYAVTIMYQPKSLLQSAVAMACYRAQLVPWDPDTFNCDNGIPADYRYPTPDLIVISNDVVISDSGIAISKDSVINQSLIDLLAPMTNRVHILSSSGKSFTGLKSTCKIDEFAWKDLYNYIRPSSTAIVYALEQLLVSYVPDFTPSFESVTVETSKCFRRVLCINGGIDELSNIYSSGFKCFQTVETMVEVGKLLEKTYVNEAKIAVDNRKYISAQNNETSVNGYYMVITSNVAYSYAVDILKDDEQFTGLVCCLDHSNLLWKVYVLGDKELLGKHTSVVEAIGYLDKNEVSISCSKFNTILP